MTKLSSKKLPSDRTGFLIDQLWKAVTLLETKEEVRQFLHDILTRTELQMLAKRLEVVKMISEGYTYEQIRKQLNISDVTIAKINNWFEAFGSGYRLIIERLHKIDQKRRDAKFRYNERRAVVTGQVRAAQKIWVGVGKELYRGYKKQRKKFSARS
ncbi:MAG: helix-turn-helix domain-containing protein [Candidatus Doudnabacteria bacterium]|nr:helix-turn-helix domain-containing protein [Candidatus Doudnabacteria bacterium]